MYSSDLRTQHGAHSPCSVSLGIADVTRVVRQLLSLPSLLASEVVKNMVFLSRCMFLFIPVSYQPRSEKALNAVLKAPRLFISV